MGWGWLLELQAAAVGGQFESRLGGWSSWDGHLGSASAGRQ